MSDREFSLSQRVYVEVNTANCCGDWDRELDKKDFSVGDGGYQSTVQINLKGSFVSSKDMEILECWLAVQSVKDAKKPVVARYHGFTIDKLNRCFRLMAKRLGLHKYASCMGDIDFLYYTIYRKSGTREIRSGAGWVNTGISDLEFFELCDEHYYTDIGIELRKIETGECKSDYDWRKLLGDKFVKAVDDGMFEYVGDE